MMCPRCGIAVHKGLCESCRYSATNTAYVWDQARREVARLLRAACECGAATWADCTVCRKVNGYLAGQRVAVWRARNGRGVTA